MLFEQSHSQISTEKRAPSNFWNSSQSGFSLMALLLVLAIIAILAGTIGPLVFRQIMKAREKETLQEMAAINKGLVAFYEDTGRFPSDAEGLVALTEDPGINNWRGPYVSGNRVLVAVEILTDAFGNDYIYDLNPITNPDQNAELILVSGGANSLISSGVLNGTWTLNGDDNDLILLINPNPAQRDHLSSVQEEMLTISYGVQSYFNDKSTFPLTTAAIEGVYMDSGFEDGVFVDPWHRNYTLIVDNSATPPTLIIHSSGPDGVDNSGLGDDITHEVSSIMPGRNSTIYMLNIIQSKVNYESEEELTGDWLEDRDDFGFSAIFETDGWGNPLEEAMSIRTILSGGPDGNYLTSGDNIPSGVIPDDTPYDDDDDDDDDEDDEDDEDEDDGVDQWSSNGFYSAGDVVSYNGRNWVCLQTHQVYGDSNWAPGIAHSLWRAQ